LTETPKTNPAVERRRRRELVMTRHLEADRTTKRWWLHLKEDDLDEEGMKAADLELERRPRVFCYSLFCY
jgi:hypothetical protein